MNDGLTRLRMRYMQLLASASIALAGIGLVPVLLSSARSAVTDQAIPIALVIFIFLNGVWLILANAGRRQGAAHGLIVTFVIASLLAPTLSLFMLIGTLAVITAAMLATTPVYLLTEVIVIGRLALGAVQLILANPGTIPASINDYTVALVTLTFISIVLRYFVSAGEQAVTTARETDELLQATAEVGQVLSQILDLDELLERAVNLIHARFNYYHVQVFLVNDTRDQAVLAASTGEVGQRLLARGHQLSVGSQSVIGQVMLRGTPVLASDTSRDLIFYRKELLPNTRAELALPIHEGEQTIAALDIQSLNPNAFKREDIQALQILADLLGTAIRNTRLSREQARAAQENEQLQRDAEVNLREIQRLNQELTHIAWQEYAKEAQTPSGVTLERDQPISMSGWSDPLRRAGQEQRVVDTGNGQNKTVAVPVMLRGEVIGAIEVEPGTETSPETVEMVQAVAQRLALSLENARLYEVTRRAAAQEQRINDIAARFQSVATVDELLRITLTELSETLGAEHGSIRLGRFEQQNEGSGHD